MKKQEEEIINYLETAYSGAKMMADEECMIRVSRAIIAFKADPYNEVFAEKFIKEKIAKETEV